LHVCLSTGPSIIHIAASAKISYWWRMVQLQSFYQLRSMHTNNCLFLGGEESDEMDIAKAIALQVGDKSDGRETVKRFQAVDTKTNNCVFIKTTLERPDELLSVFLSETAATGITKSRFILKIFPVMGTCRATEDKIEKLIVDVLNKMFADETLGTYATLYKVRCNNLGREHILPLVGRAVQQVCPGSKVDLGSPNYIISVDVLNKFCCVSVMKDFYKLKKYNIQELGKLNSSSVTECGQPDEAKGLEQIATVGTMNDLSASELCGVAANTDANGDDGTEAALESSTLSQDSNLESESVAQVDCAAAN
jgi:tRNA acetyltransferase TAN1